MVLAIVEKKDYPFEFYWISFVTECKLVIFSLLQ